MKLMAVMFAASCTTTGWCELGIYSGVFLVTRPHSSGTVLHKPVILYLYVLNGHLKKVSVSVQSHKCHSVTLHNSVIGPDTPAYCYYPIIPVFFQNIWHIDFVLSKIMINEEGYKG